MPPPLEQRYSNGQINRAGHALAESHPRESAEVRETVNHFRRLHSYPLTKANMGLRSMAQTCGFAPDVTQRLKTRASIAKKLLRTRDMKLARMADVGGCRLVLPTWADVLQVAERVQSTDRVRRTHNLVETPRPSGYRALHLVVVYDDRPIELQLRTSTQHAWAEMVERYGRSIGHDLKGGQGPGPVIAWLAAFAEALAKVETSSLDEATVDRVGMLRAQAEPYLREVQP